MQTRHSHHIQTSLESVDIPIQDSVESTKRFLTDSKQQMKDLTFDLKEKIEQLKKQNTSQMATIRRYR
jgi:hypothetical protein